MAGALETLGAATGNKNLENMGKQADDAIKSGGDAVAKGLQDGGNAVYEGGKATANAVGGFFGGAFDAIDGAIKTGIGAVEDLFNGSEVENPGDADGTEPTESGDSLLAGVDLFDFDSLDAAIAKGQEMIANGEGSAQLFGELQLLLQSQMQMVSLISNMQKVQHDTAMAAINNIR